MADFITHKLLDKIDEFANDKNGKAFFLYVVHDASLWSLYALPEELTKYKDTYEERWEALRKSRYERMTKMSFLC